MTGRDKTGQSGLDRTGHYKTRGKLEKEWIAEETQDRKGKEKSLKK